MHCMIPKSVKAESRDIAGRMPPSAAYTDSTYELYVRMKIAKGRQAVVAYTVRVLTVLHGARQFLPT